MWRPVALVAVVLLAALPGPEAAAPPTVEELSSPHRSVLDAHADLARLPVTSRPHVRYLSMYHMRKAERKEMLLALRIHLNHLSVAPSFAYPVRVTDFLYRIDLRYYQRQTTLWQDSWEALAAGNVYYNVRRKQGKKDVTLAARWLPPNEVGELLLWADSQTPVVRADWFFKETVISAGRAAGYYKWLGVKNRADYLRLVGADQKRAKERLRQWEAIVLKSGIAIRNRIVGRDSADDGGEWFTKDVFNTQTQRKNALNAPDGNFDHDAEERIGFLPNGLFAYHLNDSNGVQQDTAPDQVGPDHESTSNDKRIHAYLSCVRCHIEGLRPLRDFGRRLFSSDVAAADKDPVRFEAFAAKYLRPLDRHMRRDLKQYEEALQEVSGVVDYTSSELSDLYTSVWKQWAEDDVTLEQAARELAVSAARLQSALRKYSASVDNGGMGRLLPPSVLGLAKSPPLPVLRDHFEEAYDTLVSVLEQVERYERGRR